MSITASRAATQIRTWLLIAALDRALDGERVVALAA